MMKYLFALLITMSLSQIGLGQNLVVNGDFEQYIHCPDSLNELYECTAWTTATKSTPDYYNVCDSLLVDQVSVPLNVMGYQFPSSGNGYAGMITYHAYGNHREYIHGEIANTGLQVGYQYKISLDVVMGNKCEYASGGIAAYLYVDNLGADTATYDNLNLTPQIDFNYGLLTDTVNWLTITDTFTADSNYKHIIIGAFQDTGSILHTLFNTNTSNNNIAYYYIDNVVIEEITETSISSFNQIKNVTLSPNPFAYSASLTFQNPQQEKHTLFVYDIQGRLVKKIDDIHTNEVTIERGNLNAGCYFYELKSEDGAVAKGKLFVQ